MNSAKFDSAFLAAYILILDGRGTALVKVSVGGKVVYRTKVVLKNNRRWLVLPVFPDDADVDVSVEPVKGQVRAMLYVIDPVLAEQFEGEVK